jgi:hypothetical protein
MTHEKPRLSKSSRQRRLALSRWENEGGALARDAAVRSSTANLARAIAEPKQRTRWRTKEIEAMLAAGH